MQVTSKSGQIHLLYVSQQIEALQNKLLSAASILLDLVDNLDNQYNIAQYIANEAHKLWDKFRIEEELESKIVSSVTNSARGMLLHFSDSLRFIVALLSSSLTTLQ